MEESDIFFQTYQEVWICFRCLTPIYRKRFRMNNSINYLELFLRRTLENHNDKDYDYSKVIETYVNRYTKVEFICNKKDHGSFWQQPHKHITTKIPCPKCRKETSYIKPKKYPTIIIGTKFDTLTVLDYDKTKNKYKYTCKCDCGKIMKLRGNELHRGRRCTHIQTGERPWQRLPNNIGQKNMIYKCCRLGAKSRNYNFELTKEEFYILLEQNCYYCGAKPQNQSNVYVSGNLKYSGIDRKDNTLGYTSINSVPCCKRCNVAKNDMTMQEFHEWIRRVYDYQFNIQKS